MSELAILNEIVWFSNPSTMKSCGAVNLTTWFVDHTPGANIKVDGEATMSAPPPRMLRTTGDTGREFKRTEMDVDDFSTIITVVGDTSRPAISSSMTDTDTGRTAVVWLL